MTNYYFAIEDQRKNEIVERVFSNKPWQMGLRGDPYFWDYLAIVCASKPSVITPENIEAIVRDEFRKVSGCDLTIEVRPFVKGFAHGGMSTGLLSGRYWLETGIPLLQKRLSEMERLLEG